MAKSRRKARVAAMQALYTIDVGHMRLFDTLKITIETAELDENMAIFAEELVRGVALNIDQLDNAIKPLITDWDFDRIAVVDRCLLRIAAYELYHCPFIPPIVSINEAVEMAKRYSTAESGKFVNGVLGKLLPLTPKAHWDPKENVWEEEAKQRQEDASTLEDPVEDEIETDAEIENQVGLWKIRTENSSSES